MPLKVTKVNIWMTDVPDQPGGLAGVLKPLAEAGVDLETVIARRRPEKPGVGVVFLGPIKGKKATAAAQSVGLHEAKELVALRVEGTNAPGMGYRMTSALAAANINIRGVFATVFGNKFVSLFAFDSAQDANKAARILRGMK
ncbi:MAG: ACT domain-containing protein [Armatimonadetes bacterium]|nr:ACT domain-containing protein [Armatimonadota bacterium]MDW8120738.1 ACT domain-containing protein [Armatimonadota bacterium]